MMPTGKLAFKGLPTALTLSLLLLTPAARGQEGQAGTTGGAPQGQATTAAPQASELDSLKAEAMAYYKDRLKPASAKKAIDSMARWQVLDPGNPEPVLLEAKLILFYLSYLRGTEDTDAREALFHQGLTHCREAFAKDPSNHGADFFAAVMLANWSRERGIMSSLSSYGEMTERMDRVEKNAPGYYYGGVDRFWGRVITQVPSSVRSLKGYDLQDSIKMFQDALKVAPGFLLTHYYLGQAYIDNGEREKGKAAILKAVNGDVNALPEVKPENIMFQRMAAKFYAQEFGE